MTIATELANRIVAMTHENLPEDAFHWAKTSLIDTLGCAIAAHEDPAPRMVEKVLDAGRVSGPCLIWGTNRHASPLDAAVINGTTAHALDYDDCNASIAGHPSVSLLPGILAMGESLGASGRDVLTAYVVGFETQARLGRAAMTRQFDKGWHTTATFGIFGAAAANSRLLNLTPEKTAMAIAMAASLASGVLANLGTMTKPLHAGQAARHGLYAALLAREGFSANAEALEHRQGYLELFNGSGQYDIEKILANWANPLEILKPGIGLKRYPSCAGTHSPIDAMLSLREKHNLTTDQVVSIESVIHSDQINRPKPRSGLDAKFSAQYCIARALVNGEVTLRHFEDDAVGDPEVQKVAERIQVRPHAHKSTGMHDFFQCTLIVKTKDGKTFTINTDHPLRGPCNLAPPDRLKTKFIDCASLALRKEAIAPLFEALQGFDTLKDVRTLTNLMADAIKPHESVIA